MTHIISGFNAINILLVGQLKTARTETIEEYLKSRNDSFSVIGLMSPFATTNEARCSTYSNKEKIEEFPLPHFMVGEGKIFGELLIFISFIFYAYSIIKSLILINKKFDLFIGCATFSTACGVFLKKIGVVDRVIYYCLDFYIPPKKGIFKQFINLIYRLIDGYCINNVDVIWDISPRIREARKPYSIFKIREYTPVIVPMGWGKNVSRNVPVDKRNRWSIGFIGTLSENQGLQMVIKAFPRLLSKYPNITLNIIGSGPYHSELSTLITKFDLSSSIKMHGFISDDNEAFDVLENCMIGIAPWTGDDTDNSYYADPGKPKLYALLGLPILLTKFTMISSTIVEMGAGKAINYSEDDFIYAIEEMMGDLTEYKKYMAGLENFKKICGADSIFSNAINKTILNLKGIKNEY